MTTANTSPIEPLVNTAVVVRPSRRRAVVPVTLFLLALAAMGHFVLTVLSDAKGLDDIAFGSTEVLKAIQPWTERWRVVALVLGMALLGVTSLIRFHHRRDPRAFRVARWVAAAGAAAIGLGALTVEVPDVFRMGFAFTSFELPLRLLLVGLAASALWLAWAPEPARRVRLARAALAGSLAGIIGVLTFPQASESHTPLQMAILCDGRSNESKHLYPSCRGPLEVKAHALASPVALLPEGWALHLRTIERLRGRVAHLDRVAAAWDARDRTGGDPELLPPEPGLREQAVGAALHLAGANVRWLCLGVVVLVGLGLALGWAFFRPLGRRALGRALGRGLLVGLAASALFAAVPLLAETTWGSPWRFLPTFLLVPLALIALVGLGLEAARAPANASASTAGVVGVCHGTVETPAGPWKVSTGQSA